MATNNAVNTSLSGQTGTGNFVGATSPTLITPDLGTPTAGVITNCTGSPTLTHPILVGVTDGVAASAGDVGQVISNNASGVSLTDVTPANVTSISLTAGDWDVWGSLVFTGGATTTVVYLAGSIGTTSATINTSYQAAHFYNNETVFSEINAAFTCPQQVININSPATVYLVADAHFGTDVCSVDGHLFARRRR